MIRDLAKTLTIWVFLIISVSGAAHATLMDVDFGNGFGGKETTYSLTDISSSGVAVPIAPYPTSGNTWTDFISLGFDLDFFGGTYQMMRIDTRGRMNFISSVTGDYLTVCFVCVSQGTPTPYQFYAGSNAAATIRYQLDSDSGTIGYYGVTNGVVINQSGAASFSFDFSDDEFRFSWGEYMYNPDFTWVDSIALYISENSGPFQTQYVVGGDTFHSLDELEDRSYTVSRLPQTVIPEPSVIVLFAAGFAGRSMIGTRAK